MEYHVVSFSGGKDSTAMLLEMYRRNMQIDEILYCDTGVEFDEMYRHIQKVELMLGKRITILKSEKTFLQYMFLHEKSRGKRKGQKGYGFPSARNRWCTQVLKKSIVSRYLREYRMKGYTIIEHHGIAADESWRAENNSEKTIYYPLVEWGMVEKEALQYCYDRGLDWEGLYEHFDRVSCWLCPLQNLKELKSLWKYHQDKWKKLKLIQMLAYNRSKLYPMEHIRFRMDYSFEQLEKRFQMEEAQMNIFDLCERVV